MLAVDYFLTLQTVTAPPSTHARAHTHTPSQTQHHLWRTAGQKGKLLTEAVGA